MSGQPDRRIARVMASQRSLVTLEQARLAGFSDGMVGERLDSGRWARFGGGVYGLAGVEVTWERRGLAACLIAGKGAVLSHRSAAVVWELSCFRPGSIEILVPAGRSARNALARVHRTIELPTREVTRRRGLPVTRVGRTLIDLAGVVGPEALEEAVDDALCRRLVPLEELRARVAHERGRGCVALRRVLAAWGPGPLPGGLAEMRTARWLLAHGAPMPVRQYIIRDEHGRFVARVDLALPAQRVVLEVNSMRWHGTPRGLARDECRDARIRAAGWALFWCAPGEPPWDALAAIQCAKTAA